MLLDHLDNRRRLHQTLEGYQIIAHKLDQMDLRTFLSFTASDAIQIIGDASFVPPGFLYQDDGTEQSLYDPFGNQVFVRTVNARLVHSGGGSGANWQQLELAVEDVTTDICTQLVSQLNWGNNSRLATIVVGPAGGTATSFQRASGTFLVVDATSTSTFPVSPTSALTACTEPRNTIRWRFVKAPA
jgi:hypothetical protein